MPPITPKQMAHRMCISLSLAYLLLRKQMIPAYRVGVRGRGKWLVKVADVDAYMASCKWVETPDRRTHAH